VHFTFLPFVVHTIFWCYQNAGQNHDKNIQVRGNSTYMNAISKQEEIHSYFDSCCDKADDTILMGYDLY
jgi:hypothetical protein